MTLNEEIRQSETRNRTATICPRTTFHHTDHDRYSVKLIENGRVLTRVYFEKCPNLTAARKIARAWCQ
jgi:hypothetical protein